LLDDQALRIAIDDALSIDVMSRRKPAQRTTKPAIWTRPCEMRTGVIAVRYAGVRVGAMYVEPPVVVLDREVPAVPIVKMRLPISWSSVPVAHAVD
jgi:hypothetical protein